MAREPGRDLDRAEALLELAIGFAQRFFGVDLEMACEVDDGEQQVADFLLDHLGRRGGDLVEFLDDLGLGAFDVGPVEAGARGALLKLGGAFERGQRHGHAGERALVGDALRVPRP